MSKTDTNNLNRFKEYIEKACEVGKLPKGFTPYMMQLLMRIHDDIIRFGKAEFLTDVCRLLNRFGIKTKEYGIGYIAYV